MPDAPFRIAVTGDTGWDIYTEYVKGFMSDDRRVLKPEVAYDLYVASGAAFTTLALRELLGSDPECGIETQHLVPFEGLEDPWDGHVFSTLIKLLVELKQFADRRSPEARVLRVARVRPLLDEAKVAGPEVFYHLVQAPPVYGQRHRAPEPGTIKLLIIHDGAGKWRNYPVQPPNPPPATRADAPDAIEGMKLVETVLASEAGPTPRIIVSLDHDLPPVQNRHGKLAFDGSQFWDVLAKRKESVCVICSVDILRREGAAISRRLSWEQTVEDLAGDLVWFDKLKALAQFKHLVIPIGQAAALHVMNEGSQRSVDLIFAPLARTGIYRDAVEDGEIVGRNAFMIASLARLFASPGQMQKPIRGAFAEAIRSGLLASMQAFDSGYCSPWGEYKRKDLDAEGKRAMSSNLVRRMFEGRQRLPNRSATHTIRKGYTTDEHRPDQVLGVVEVPEEVLSNPPRRSPGMKPDWEILKKTIEQFGMKPDAKPPVKPDAWRINVAIAVVLFGPDKVFNRRWTDDDTEVIRTLNRPVLCTESPDYLTLPAGHQLPMPETPIPVAECANSPPLPMFVPIMTFGKLTVIERDEIESIRSIRNQFKTYVEESRTANAATPLCVAVFGPPGSGKSFAVKEIAEDINSTLQNPKQGLEPVEYNVAQFRNVDDLGDAITRAGVINNEGRIPLVFFDEFDCPCNGPLGWLKYFLAPMQDATFYAARQTIKIARAIFVFAGGIYHSFEQFDPSLEYRLKRMNDEESKARQERLRIFRDQKGPDFVSRLRGHINIRPINGDADNTPKPLIRRAIILRGLMQKRWLLSRVENLDVAAIDEDVLYALLTVDRFRHGARSLEAILNMCAPIEGRIEKASLPSSAQLNMHIDSHAFFTRIYRARFRPRRADADRAAAPAPGAGNSRPGVSPPEAPAPPPASVPPAIPGGGTKERPAGEPEPAAEGGTHPTAEETGS